MEQVYTSQSELRAVAMERAEGRCEWPDCGSNVSLEMAHLQHRKMGGNPSMNTLDNVVILCGAFSASDHHGILDGRIVMGRQREVVTLLTAFLDRA